MNKSISMNSIINNSSYEPIADEYYDSRHITSRNFDTATLAFCKTFDFHIFSKGLILELGSGIGCTGKYCKIVPTRVIQIDTSLTMLMLKPRENCLHRIKCNALNLPFTSGSFSGVTAFLFDPYDKFELYREVYRVLQSEGLFIGTLPHFKWGTTLRKILGYDFNKTKFLTKENKLIEFGSLLMSDSEIENTIKQAGFVFFETHDLCLPSDIKNISEHILIPARHLKLDVYALPIVKLIIAKK